VHTGALPARAEYLDRLDPWLRRLAADQPAHISHPLRPYARWSVLPAKRTTTAVTIHAAGHARGKIRSALHLLTWLDQQQIRLEHTSQADLDRYLAAVSDGRQALLAAFVTWTTAAASPRRCTYHGQPHPTRTSSSTPASAPTCCAAA
jgi:hypothetical protein